MIGVGSILTKGLGGDATALILGGFRLFIQVDIEPPIEPEVPGSGGTGGSWAGPGQAPYHWRRDDETEQRHRVTITVKVRGNTYQQQYLVDAQRAAYIVRVTNFINTARARLSVGVQNVKRVAGKITAIFTPKDK